LIHPTASIYWRQKLLGVGFEGVDALQLGLEIIK